MEEWKERVIKEYNEVEERLAKLKVFAASDKIGMIPINEQKRLTRQQYIMELYAAVLAERIHADFE